MSASTPNTTKQNKSVNVNVNRILNNNLSNLNSFNSTSSNTKKNNSTPSRNQQTSRSSNNTSNSTRGVNSAPAAPSILNNIPAKISSATSTVTDAVSNAVEKVQDTVSNTVNTVESIVEERDDLFYSIIKISVVVLILIAIFYILRYLFMKYQSSLFEAPYLLEGIKNAKHALVISQDPNNAGFIPMPRSVDQDGIQFTYSFWLMIDGYDYNAGKWKHIFHKGDQNSYPNRAPGLWLAPDTNSMRVYMNTQTSILEYVDIPNMPMRKWVHVAVILDDTNLDVYINGYLKARHKLSSVPKQNSGDFWCNMYGGFDGFVARIRYFAKAISPEELTAIVKEGPGSGACVGTDEVPPYLDDDWWLD